MTALARALVAAYRRGRVGTLEYDVARQEIRAQLGVDPDQITPRFDCTQRVRDGVCEAKTSYRDYIKVRSNVRGQRRAVRMAPPDAGWMNSTCVSHTTPSYHDDENDCQAHDECRRRSGIVIRFNWDRGDKPLNHRWRCVQDCAPVPLP